MIFYQMKFTKIYVINDTRLYKFINIKGVISKIEMVNFDKRLKILTLIQKEKSINIQLWNDTIDQHDLKFFPS